MAIRGPTTAALLGLLLLPSALAGFPEDSVRVLEGFVTGQVGRATPHDPEGVLLLGRGVSTVTRGGHTVTCSGDVPMVLEASRKAFDLEPIITMAYGGGRAEGAALIGCLMGQARQPGSHEVEGQFSGPWSAVKYMPGHTWRIDVGAPRGDGTREVSFLLQSNSGDRDTFHGFLTEYR